MKFFFILPLLFFSFSLLSQEKNGEIQIHLTFENEIIEFEKKYFSPIDEDEDEIEIETIRFYISNIEFFQNEKMVFDLEKKHFLVDLENPASLKIEFPQKDISFDKIKFNLGVDSLTNVSGAFGGDLDPSNGMYWTWQSGYINFKLEGISKKCPARKNRFQFHLGGYQAPFYNLQKIELPVFSQKEIKIKIAIDDFFDKINLKETYQVMSPNQQAVEMAKLVASIFSSLE